MTASLTSNFGFQRLGAGDSLSTNGYKFLDADRDFLDKLLKLTLHHNHSGVGVGSVHPDPQKALTLTLDTTQGNLPAGSRVYYRYTLVDVNGFETGPSPESYVDTPAPVATPAAPTLSAVPWPPASNPTPPIAGTYSYVITALTSSVGPDHTTIVQTSNETLASPVTTITLDGLSFAALLFPTMPPGVDGVNMYRRGPGEALFGLIGSVFVGAGGWTDYYGYSGTNASPNRTIPVANTTHRTNQVTATIPAATPHSHVLAAVAGGVGASVVEVADGSGFPSGPFSSACSVPVVAGSTYVFSVDVAGDGSALAAVTWLDGAGAPIFGGQLSVPNMSSSSAGWVTLTAQGPAPVGAVGCTFAVACYTNAGNTIYFGAPVFGLVGGPNLIVDPDFIGGNWQAPMAASFSVLNSDPIAPTPGMTWKLYRTVQLANYTNSLVHWVVETTVQGGTIIATTYVDAGNATQVGTPPLQSMLQTPPTKVNLATETSGRASLAQVDVIPFTISFSQAGTLTVQTGKTVWVNEYPFVEIVGIRALLGVGSAPASTPVQVQLKVGRGASPTYVEILEADIPVGTQIGAFVPVNSIGSPPAASVASGTTTPWTLNAGDSLGLDVTQTGGGGTPTDANLTVNVYMVARYTASGSLFV